MTLGSERRPSHATKLDGLPHARGDARVVSHRRAGPAVGWASWPLQLHLLRGPRCLLDGQCICWDACLLGPRDAAHDSGRSLARTIPVARSLAANPAILVFRCFKHHALSAQAVESQNALSEF